MLKFFGWVVFSLLLIGAIFATACVLYLETSIDSVLTESDTKELINSINNSPSLPESFYTVQEKYYPGKFDRGIWYALFNQVLGNKTLCPCKDLYFSYFEFNSRIDDLIVKLEIEDQSSAKKCFEYDMATSDFGRNTTGIKNASLLYFNKELSTLSEDEILTLLFIHKAPISYNPNLNSERLKNAILNLKKNQAEL